MTTNSIYMYICILAEPKIEQEKILVVRCLLGLSIFKIFISGGIMFAWQIMEKGKICWQEWAEMI